MEPQPHKQREEAAIEVPSRGGEPKESKEPELPPGPNPELEEGKKTEVSQEDAALKERLDLAVERLMEGGDSGLQRAAIELLRKEIREATSSMTSVPKPLKFLAEHWPRLKAYFAAIGGVLPERTPDVEESEEAAEGGKKKKKGGKGKKGAAAATGAASTSPTAAAASAPAPVLRHAPAAAMMTPENRAVFADVLSVLAMTMGAPGGRETLRYKLVGNADDLESWGHEYVRTLAGEIGGEYQARTLAAAPLPVDDLLAMVRRIIPFNMSHNAEVEAVDLCLETEQLSLLTESGMVDAGSVSRVCAYLVRCADYLGDEEEVAAVLDVAFKVYVANGAFPDALRTALRMGAKETRPRLDAVFAAATDAGVRLQLAYMLGRHRACYEVGADAADADALNAAIGNQSLSGLYAAVARDLDLLEPKTPEDVYKAHLAGNAGASEGLMTSARANLAATYVNAFVNVAYGNDKVMSPADSDWVFKNKDVGMMAAAASLGMLHLWDESSISSLDKYLEAADDHVKGGALLGVALACAGTRSDASVAFGLLAEHAEFGSTSTPHMRIGSIIGLGIAYAGTRREDIKELLTPHVVDTESSFERTCMAGMALGMVFAGAVDEELATTLAGRLVEASAVEASQSIARHLVLGLGLLFLGQGDLCEPTLLVVEAMPQPLAAFAAAVVRSCAYAGTGNVLQIQTLLRICAEHPEAEDKKKADEEAKARQTAREKAAAEAALRRGGAGGAAAAAAGGGAVADAAGGAVADAAGGAASVTAVGKYMHQSAAVLGLALVSLGEELSVELATRMSDHLLQYGDTAVRRAVPLALGLLHLSDPAPAIVDQLSRLTHDPNEETSQSAIFAMGLVGAGTNNSRVAGLLRTLAIFHKTSPAHLFVVRIAQGILHAGRGLVTLSPLHSDRLLVSHVSLACILPTVFLLLDPAASLHHAGSKWHLLLYTLAGALNPRFMVTVAEPGAEGAAAAGGAAMSDDAAPEAAAGPVPITVEVRVGQAVETVGQAGRPKTITGFQTHTTPVLIGAKDRAEMADDAYLPLTSVLEGVVVLRKNPNARKGKGVATAGGAAK